MTKLPITIGETYELGSYKDPKLDKDGYATRPLRGVRVRVTGVDSDVPAWYDDHQEGGWETKGTVSFEYLESQSPNLAKPEGEFVESLEYAQDNWSQS